MGAGRFPCLWHKELETWLQVRVAFLHPARAFLIVNLMTIEIARRTCPEEEKLARKREELALLQAELAERELFLTNLRAELSAFAGQYLRQVGALYAELDELNAKIAERLAGEEGTDECRSAAAQARTQAEESDSAVRGEAAKVQEFILSAELKVLYSQNTSAKLRHSPGHLSSDSA